ncbi:hypothetical protein CF326_g9171 [Tilletia indica]|nr:hypothetical protein CF326_g9171 [Tilletia indica]
MDGPPSRSGDRPLSRSPVTHLHPQPAGSPSSCLMASADQIDRWAGRTMLHEVMGGYLQTELGHCISDHRHLRQVHRPLHLSLTHPHLYQVVCWRSRYHSHESVPTRLAFTSIHPASLARSRNSTPSLSTHSSSAPQSNPIQHSHGMIARNSHTPQYEHARHISSSWRNPYQSSLRTHWLPCMITTHDLRTPALARSALGSALCWVGKYDEAGENGDFIAYGFNQCALAELCRLGFSGWSASFFLGWSNKYDSNNDNGGTGSQSTPCRAYRQVELRPRIPSSNLPWVIGELALLRDGVERTMTERTMTPGDEGEVSDVSAGAGRNLVWTTYAALALAIRRRVIWRKPS